jgi:hypothetical protein
MVVLLWPEPRLHALTADPPGAPPANPRNLHPLIANPLGLSARLPAPPLRPSRPPPHVPPAFSPTVTAAQPGVRA